MIYSDQLLLIIAISGVLLALLSLFLVFYLFMSLKRIQKNLDVLFSGKEAKSLESIIIEQTKDISALDKEIQDLFEISNQIHALTQKSLHKVGIVRFNPFKDIGGDQSFALALLDGKNSGLVVSSLHTREGTRIYSKPITRGDSRKYPLTDEEKEAIKSAINTFATKS